MDCSEAKACVEPFLNGSLPVLKARAFLKHMENCPSCYEELETGCLIRMTDKSLQDKPEGYDLDKMMDSIIDKHEKKLHRFVALVILGIWVILGLAVLLILHLNGLL